MVLPAWEGAGDSYGGTAVNTTAVCVPLVVRHGKPPPTVCSGAKKLPIVNRANTGALASSWPPVCLLLSFGLPRKASPEPLGRYLFIRCPPLSSPTLSHLPLPKAVDKVRKSGQIIYFNPSLSSRGLVQFARGRGEREKNNPRPWSVTLFQMWNQSPLSLRVCLLRSGNKTEVVMNSDAAPGPGSAAVSSLQGSLPSWRSPPCASAVT